MSNSAVRPHKKAREGTAVRRRGKARADKILETAKNIVLTEGIAGLSTRRVSDTLGISVGNLAYYFPTKDSLLQAMIESVIEGYDEELRHELEDFPNDSVGRLTAFLKYMIDDAKKPEVHGFFYQFWGLSMYNEEAAATRTQMYVHFRDQLVGLLREVHPAITKVQVENMAFGILTFLEGLHVIYGSGDIERIRSDGFKGYALKQLQRIAGIESR